MTWALEGIAYGPRGQSMEVTWGGYESREDVPHPGAMRTALRRGFRQAFDCDAEHVEAHIKEEVNDDRGEAPTAV